jgi:hypothetical protein
MLSVTGIYDGKSIYLTKSIDDPKKYKVIITFVEELDNEAAEELNLRDFGMSSSSLSFWDDPKEDIYQDFLPARNNK